jgi:branched-chain amino acid transport system substrate-binding protein
MNELRTTEAAKLIEHWEKGAKFDLLKTREGYFRASDHQLMHEMYTVEGLGPRSPNQWDIFRSSPAIPGPGEPLEAIAATAEENQCRMS